MVAVGRGHGAEAAQTEVSPFAVAVLMRAVGVSRPPSIAEGLPEAYSVGEPNAVRTGRTRFGADLPTPWPQVLR